MAKDTIKETKVEQPKVEAPTYVWLKSKANYIIEIKEDDKSLFIPPYGRIKINKAKLSFINDLDAHFTTFIKA